MSLFGIDIAELIAEGFRGKLNPITLSHTTPGEYNAITDTVADPVTTTTTSEGIVDEFDMRLEAEGLLTRNQRMLIILADNLAFDPKIGDDISIDSEDFTIVGIPSQDPAKATWTVKGEF